MNKEVFTKLTPEPERHNGIHVMKFGGSSVGDINGLYSIGEIVKSEQKNSAGLLIVVSALNGTTNELLSLCNLIHERKLEEKAKLFKELIHKHIDFIYNLKMSEENTCETIREVFKIGLQLDQDLFSETCLTPQRKDRIISSGEKFSSIIVSGYLRDIGLPVKAIDGSSIVKTNNNFGKALPDMEKTGENARNALFPEIEKGVIPIITGFIGSTENGETTVFDRGGSDHTASIFARELGADQLTLWKEVDGIFDKDPKVHKDAKLYEELTFEEADQIAKNGNKVLAYRTIEPLFGTEIVAYIKNTFHPERPGTRICCRKDTEEVQ